MPPTSQSAKLKDALREFQSQLERDVEMDDPAQVNRWADAVRVAFDDLEAIVKQQRLKIHTKLYKVVEDQDASQQKQIDELQLADAHIAQLLEIAKSQLIVLSMHSTAEIEPRVENQGFDNEPALSVMDRGMELIHWIREQEESVSSWFAEAFAESV